MNDPLIRSEISALLAKQRIDRVYKKERARKTTENDVDKGKTKFDKIENKQEIYESYKKIGKVSTVAKEYGLSTYIVNNSLDSAEFMTLLSKSRGYIL